MRVEDWGLTEYGTASCKQLEYVEEVALGGEERLVFCMHPPVVTLGRATTPQDISGWSGATYESSRGGRATYHGPNQLVIYPIVDLRKPRSRFGPRDIHAYLRVLESGVVQGLELLGLKGATGSIQEDRDADAVALDATAPADIKGVLSAADPGPSRTGVWVKGRKVASIGIAVRKWIAYHGVAVNLFHDPTAFQGIRPCGFTAEMMTSLERETGTRADIAAAQDIFAGCLVRRLE
ncbi:MAG: lipoyl(octanoyl) transferase LipB [Bdellovibrionales bacterium]